MNIDLDSPTNEDVNLIGALSKLYIDVASVRQRKKRYYVVCDKVMDTKSNRKDTADIIKNFNKIKGPDRLDFLHLTSGKSGGMN